MSHPVMRAAGADGLHEENEEHGPRIADLRFRFGTRDLKPKMHWLCPDGCVGGCNCAGAESVVETEDGEHITLELEHAQ